MLGTAQPSAKFALLPYQARWVYDTSKVKVAEKSRQIGWTYATAYEAVMVASAQKYSRPGFGMDVFVMSMSAPDARKVLETCAEWIDHLRPTMRDFVGHGVIQEGDWLRVDGEKDEAIQAYRIQFPSGFSIYGLPSKPSRLRGHTGYAICDEAAQQDLGEFRKAVGAFTVWGGRVAYISTHLGAENPFYHLVEEARGSDKISLHSVSLTDAVAEGLFERIARKARIPATPEAEAEWIQGVKDTYKEHFDEECLLIVDQAGGQEIPRAMVQACSTVGPVECPVIEISAKAGRPSTLKINGEMVAESDRPWAESDPKETAKSVEMWLDLHLSPHLAALTAEGLDIHPGLDYGKERDLSVYTLLQRTRTNQRRQRMIIELEHVPWPIQDLIADYMWPRIDGVLRSGCGDKGGPGANSVDRAVEATNGRIVGIQISDRWHSIYWSRLRKRFEERMIAVARHHKPLEDDLASIRRHRGKIRPPKSKAGSRGQTRHADAAVALALAEQAIEIEPQSRDQAPPQRRGYSRADLTRAMRRRNR